MTHVKTEQQKHTPWFAEAGAACSIVPISRFVGENVFALKGGGYGCLFTLAGIDEEGLTDQELEARVRSIEGALRAMPEGSCLHQYTRVRSGFDLPRQKRYRHPVTDSFVNDRLKFLSETASFRRIDLHWCLKTIIAFRRFLAMFMLRRRCGSCQKTLLPGEEWYCSKECHDAAHHRQAYQ